MVTQHSVNPIFSENSYGHTLTLVYVDQDWNYLRVKIAIVMTE